MKHNEKSQPQRLLVNTCEASHILGISRRTLWRLMFNGVLNYIHCGKRRMIKVSDLTTLCETGTSLDALKRVRAVASTEVAK